MSEASPSSFTLYLEAFWESLCAIDDFGVGDYRNHLPRWVYALILLSMTYGSM